VAGSSIPRAPRRTEGASIVGAGSRLLIAVADVMLCLRFLGGDPRASVAVIDWEPVHCGSVTFSSEWGVFLKNSSRSLENISPSPGDAPSCTTSCSKLLRIAASTERVEARLDVVVGPLWTRVAVPIEWFPKSFCRTFWMKLPSGAIGAVGSWPSVDVPPDKVSRKGSAGWVSKAEVGGSISMSNDTAVDF
jgi:hypothetical protein